MSDRTTAPPSLADETEPDRRAGRRRAVGVASSILGHVLVVVTLFLIHAPPPRPPEPDQPPMQISMVDLPKDDPKPPAPPSPSPTPPKAGGQHSAIHLPKIPPPMPDPELVAAKKPAPDNSDILSDRDVVGAATTGEGEGGGGGGGCNIAQAVQRALRQDPLVLTSVSEAHRAGKAIRVWNGDWVRNGDQDGKGLSAVREAIQWEVAFSSESCRRLPMHGMVLLSLGDGSRFAVGGGDWRWSDLLGVKG